MYTVYCVKNTGYHEYSDYTKIELQGLVYVYEYEWLRKQASMS